jgi:carbon-monoxide dehydrogenase iron sulfur subunit
MIRYLPQTNNCYEIYNMQKIYLDSSRCHGCRLCELACSLHKSGYISFNVDRASATVLRHSNIGEFEVSTDSECDNCINEEFPLCVKYCMFGARILQR